MTTGKHEINDATTTKSVSSSEQVSEAAFGSCYIREFLALVLCPFKKSNERNCEKLGSMCPAAAGHPNAPAHNMSGLSSDGHSHSHRQLDQESKSSKAYGFQMPLHYPRYKKADYEKMPEWQLDCLLKEYGLPTMGDVNEKRKFAMGAFLWDL